MILILVAMLPVIPVSHSSLHSSTHPQLSDHSSQSDRDPNATLTAFNYTYAQADLYTNSSKGFNDNATLPSYAHLSWLQTVPRTSTGGLVPGSAFKFNVTKPTAPGREVLNWTTLIIPKFNCQGCNKTQIIFEFFGNLTKGTSASYSLYNGTQLVAIHGQENNTITFSGQQQSVTGCSQPNVCINATKYIGFNLTLTFHLGWNSTAVAGGTGMSVDVGELVVTSVDQTFKKSTSNFMFLANPTTVNHQADLSRIAFNATVSYPKPGSSTLLLNHTWASEVLDIYYPAGYQINQISLNSTPVFPVTPHIAFDTELCSTSEPNCSTSLLSLNMSDFFKASTNSTAVVKMTSPNSVSPLKTLTSGVPVSQFLPGDGLTVQVVNKLSAANITTTVNPRLNITIIDSLGSNSSISPRLNLPNPSGGNFTSTVPTGPFGTWTVIVSFVSNYDMGSNSKPFSVEEIQMSPNTFGYSGSNNALAAQGKMTYATSNSTTLLASNVNGVIFAVDTGTPTTNPITTITTNPSSTSLYIANVTLVNGVFSQTQTLVMTFTIVNPTFSSLFSANVTIEHEWTSGQTHGASVTIPLVLGDQPFSTQVSKRYSYEADISFASNPIQVKLTSLTTLNSKTASLSQGSDPIVPNRQHTGLFKITISSISVVLGSSPLPPSSLESPPYAYIPGLPSYGGRYLAYATFTTASDGIFSTTTSSNAILGAKKLVLFALARDPRGVTLVNGQNPGPADSTILQASLDPINQLTVGQTIQPTLHLTSNASKITEIITVTETLQGSGVVDSHKVTIQPGASQPVSFTLTAPQTAGSYTVTFSSPEYGGPFASQTVQVSVVSSNLQLLIPAAIGLVAAIIVLGFYLVRRTPEKDMEEKEEKPRPTGPKPKTQPGGGSSTSKSLTQTRPRF